MQQRLKYWRTDNLHWQTREKWYPAGWGFNNRVISNIHSRLHYLACHAPNPVNKQWTAAYKNFYKKHFGVHKGVSVRYLNKWSCHSWM
jgi:hypothetical protein